MKNYMMTFLLIAVIVAGGCEKKTEVVLYPESERSEQSDRESEMTEKRIETDVICVYVCGAVKRPGIVELKRDARVYEALEACGGLSEEADKRSINHAAVLTDGMQITVLTEAEAERAGASPNYGEDTVAEGKVNINQATAAELKTLPGIGDAKAADIIQYREQSGSFSSIEEIKNISGIKDAVFEKIKDKILI